MNGTRIEGALVHDDLGDIGDGKIRDIPAVVEEVILVPH